MPESTVAAFRRAVEAGDADGVLATLSDEVNFDNPVIHKPSEGRETMAFVVPKVLAVWQGLRYVAELRDDEVLDWSSPPGSATETRRGSISCDSTQRG